MEIFQKVIDLLVRFHFDRVNEPAKGDHNA